MGTVIGAIIFSKGAPYRQPLYSNVIMAVWAVCAISTVMFMSLYKSEDFAQRLNFKIAPHYEFQIIAVIGIIINFLFCYFWEIFLLDGVMFQKVLPWYKEKIRGPNLEFEHLERELSNSSVWPPLGKNNDVTLGLSSGGKYTGYSLPDVTAGINNKNQAGHISRKDLFSKDSTARNLRNRMSGTSEEASELLSEAFENPESTPVHIATSPRTLEEEEKSNYQEGHRRIGEQRHLERPEGDSMLTDVLPSSHQSWLQNLNCISSSFQLVCSVTGSEILRSEICLLTNKLLLLFHNLIHILIYD